MRVWLYASEGGRGQYTRRNTAPQQRRVVVAAAAGSMGAGSGETAGGIIIC